MGVLVRMREALWGRRGTVQDYMDRMTYYRARMQNALERMRLAEMQIAQAKELEELDMGRTALQQAFAEVQHLIRAAKRERGIPVRAVGDSEEIYRSVVDTIAGRRGQGAAHRRTDGG